MPYWNERYYNETLSSRVTDALGRSVTHNPIPEAKAKAPGLFQARYSDVVTDSMKVKPRLQNFAAAGFQSSPYVETVDQSGARVTDRVQARRL